MGLVCCVFVNLIMLILGMVIVDIEEDGFFVYVLDNFFIVFEGFVEMVVCMDEVFDGCWEVE